MKGLIKTALVGMFGTSLLALTGCVSTDCTYDDVVDPCYPQRYEAMSRREVNEAMAPQMMNGHILDQTVWDHQFELGTDKLTPGGLEHLKYLARRRPHADPVIFLQATQDVPYDPAAPELYARARAELNNRRVQAIQKFLVAYSAGNPQAFQVVVHDAPVAGQSAIGVRNAVFGMYSSYQGSLGFGGAGGTTGGVTTPGGTATATASSTGGSSFGSVGGH